MAPYLSSKEQVHESSKVSPSGRRKKLSFHPGCLDWSIFRDANLLDL